MNPNKSAEETLKGIFPILIVLIVLIAGVIVMPSLTADPRSRASEPKTTVTPIPTKITPSATKPEIVCSDLYSPVCDTIKYVTYPNECEAGLAGAKSLKKGTCDQPAPLSLPTSN